jgi:hypothetical protein
MDFKELKVAATKRLKELEKDKKTLLMLLAKIEELKTVPKEKKEAASDKIFTWCDTVHIDDLL